MSQLTLVGPLSHPAMLEALDISGRAVILNGRLSGGQRAGLHRDGWPILRSGDGELPAVEAVPTLALRRYAEVLGLNAQVWQGRRVMGAFLHGPDGAPWTADCWLPDLAAGLARAILDQPDRLSSAEIAQRLPSIAGWVDAQLRAAQEARPDFPKQRDGESFRVMHRAQPYAGFFAVEEWDLSHRRHDGTWSQQMHRSALVTADAAVVLPWDMRRDRVLVIEQFRFAPALRSDRQPWLLEPIAGRVDAGETPESAVVREAMEEAGLRLQRLIPAVSIYPSPGALAEYLYLFVAPVDLPDNAVGTFGLVSEAEDIRTHLMDRSTLTQMALAGELPNGPLTTLALWLDARAADLQVELRYS